METLGLSATEAIGFLTGVVNVWMLARQHVWNWPVGLANNAFYIVVFLRSGLYGDAGLQVVYITLGVYGWWVWTRRRVSGSAKTLPVTSTPRAVWMWLVPATAVAAVALYLLLSRFTDSTVPVWDGLTTALSLAAIYGQARKYVESWWIWIVADLVYIPLYAYKNLFLTAALYAIFLGLCVMGLREWRKSFNVEPA